MEAYPPEYTEHNLPLVLLSGLGERADDGSSIYTPQRPESGIRIQSSLPECTGDRAQQLLQHFLQLDGTGQSWNSSALPGPSGNLKYKVKVIGRTYTFPPRKAAPIPQPTSPDGAQNQQNSPPRSTELHSPLSPLSPGSPIFPDGVMTPLWFTKHQRQVPSLFISFFNISAHDSSSDEQLKNDINTMRNSLIRSGFKTRFAAVLISDRSIIHASELEDRLASIRKVTSLDSKTGFFFMPPMSSAAEISTFVQSVTTALQPLCAEYYRDLSRHARRKKTKGAPTSSIASTLVGGTHALSVPGWNVRYEVKQGVFAEFRQEMDTAERHYAAAIDELFNAEGILEATPNWSPRWDEARLLSDCLALRVLRCFLWNSHPTGGAKFWVNYRIRMKELIDRRGKGSQTYGWTAWEARWAEIMSQVIQKADLPDSQPPLNQIDESTELSSRQVYFPPEKTITSMERVPPFQYLHPPSYWLRLAVKNARLRRRKALDIPEEDIIPPGQSPASAVASRTNRYDSYLALDPHEESPLSSANGFDHIANLSRLTKESVQAFQTKGHGRISDLMKLDYAHDLMDVGKYQEAMQILLPMYQDTTWRNEGWFDLLAELLLAVRQCAEHQKDPTRLLDTTYELLGIQSSLSSEITLNLEQCLDDVQLESSEPIALSYQNEERLSPVAISLAFENKETHVGEAIGCQLSIASCVNERNAALRLSSITLSFGTSKTVKIVHESNSTDAEGAITDLSEALEENEGVLEAKADLTSHTSQPRIFNFSMIFRDAEEIRVSQATIEIHSEKFQIEHSFTEQNRLRSDSIFVQAHQTLERRLLRWSESTVVTILPKPPKVQILLHGLRKQYYVDEIIRLTVEILNDEVEAVEGTLKADVDTTSEINVRLSWNDDTESASSSTNTSVERRLANLLPGASQKAELLIKAPTEPCVAAIVIGTYYSISSDHTTPLQKTIPLELSFGDPSDAKFNFGPLVYRDPWPSYFDPKSGKTQEDAGGIPQLWSLNCQLRSLAASGLVVHKTEVVMDSVIGDSQASAKRPGAAKKQIVEADKTVQESFELQTTKHSLDDRRPTTVESTLIITWSHDQDSEQFSTRIPAPRLALPVSEPRVLCTLAEDPPENVDVVLEYHIENPSTHFLTFAVSMDASEEFAFSGSKYRTLSLAPLSRHRLDYHITLHDSDETSTADGRWIWPMLQVTDSYYQKTLRVHPGGANVRFDDKQNIGVWIETP